MAQLLKILYKRREPSMMDSMNQRFEIRKEEGLALSIEGEEENHFDKLSDDLIVCHMFDKLPDSKSLFHCSLVCKRFSSLVYQVSAISLFLVPEKQNLAKRLIRRWTDSFFSWRGGFKSYDELCDIDFLDQLMFNFLKNFKALRYVNIEFDSLRKLRMEPLIKWRLDAQSDSLVMLFAKNLDSGARVSGDIISYYMSRAATRLNVIYLSLLVVRMVCLQTQLQSVVFTFSEKEGTLTLDEKGILSMRNLSKNYRDFSLRIWHEPKLELPSSGHVMEDVMLFVFKGDDMVDAFLIAGELGEGKEKIYSEAAIEMLKKEVKYQTVGRSKIYRFTFRK